MAGDHTPPGGGNLQALPGEAEAGLHQRKTGDANGHGPAAMDVEAPGGSGGGGSGGGKDAAAADEAAAAADKEEEQYANVTYLDITKQFSLLGWTAFGGPAAHIGLFQRVRAGVVVWRMCLHILMDLGVQHLAARMTARRQAC